MSLRFFFFYRYCFVFQNHTEKWKRADFKNQNISISSEPVCETKSVYLEQECKAQNELRKSAYPTRFSGECLGEQNLSGFGPDALGRRLLLRKKIKEIKLIRGERTGDKPCRRHKFNFMISCMGIKRRKCETPLLPLMPSPASCCSII